MDSKRQTLTLFLVLTIFPFTIKASSSSSNGGNMVMYWGQNIDEGTLKSTCDNGFYKIVLLSYLNVFGEGRIPKLNFTSHCDDQNPCTKLEPEIVYCQQKGVKVFLSLGGDYETYSLGSIEDAKNVAHYVFTNFFNGQSGPLGSITLNGVSLDIQGGSDLSWEFFARYLLYIRQNYRYFYLAVASQCIIPDHYLDKAIKTGSFDYAIVKFYNNLDCQYDRINSNDTLLTQSWNAWTCLVQLDNKVFMGLLGSATAVPSGGYIPQDYLLSNVLPHIIQSYNYGGIVIWDRFHDDEKSYSKQIKEHVKQPTLQFVTQVFKAIVRSVSTSLNLMLPNSIKGKIALKVL